MSFQAVIPPVPNREQERELISKTEQNFLAQSYTQGYMNESVRTVKMDVDSKLATVERRRWFNFFTGLAVTGLFVLPLNRMSVRMSSGVPFYYRPKMTSKLLQTTYYHQHRSWRTAMYQAGLWIFSAYAYSEYFTDATPHLDEYYEDFKVKPIV